MMAPAAENHLQDLYRQTRARRPGRSDDHAEPGRRQVAGGWFGNSLALVRHAAHSLGDALASAGVYGALGWAAPRRQGTSLRSSRAEAISAFGVALLLLLSGLGVGWEAVSTS